MTDDPKVSSLVDVTGLPLDDERWGHTAVADSVRAILEDLEAAAEAISGWSSFIDN